MRLISFAVFFLIAATVAGQQRPVVTPPCKNCTTNVRAANGQIQQQAITSGGNTTYRNQSGMYIGSSRTQGGQTVVRDAKGQYLYTINSK